MVYNSGSRNARNQSSIVNRPTCGGPKKAGTAPRVGWFMSSQPFLLRAPQNNPTICVPNYTIQTQSYGYRATHGGNMG